SPSTPGSAPRRRSEELLIGGTMRSLWMCREKKNALWRGIGFGAGIGAGLMYLLDPDRGRRRRALVWDKVVHLAHVTERTPEGRSRDRKNRDQGVAAQIRWLFRNENSRQDRNDESAQAPQEKEPTVRRRRPTDFSSAGARTSKAPRAS